MGKELKQAKGGSYYWTGTLSVGVYMKDGKAVLIDTGLDDQTAGTINAVLKKNKASVSAIINTHSHADHCGGNNYFQGHYKDVQIYSGKFEKHYIEDTINEPRCFCGGAAPIAELRNKFLEAKSSIVTKTIEPYEDQNLIIDGQTFRIVTLPGHSPGMIGVITPDNILYCGDAIFGADTFSKHGMLFYTDIAKTLETFDKLAGLAIDGCVFYHGGYIADIKPVVAAHKAKVEQTANVIEALINDAPCSFSELTARAMAKLNIPQNVMQFTLTETCVKAYVAYLQSQKKITIEMDDVKMIIKGVAVTASIEPEHDQARVTM